MIPGHVVERFATESTHAPILVLPQIQHNYNVQAYVTVLLFRTQLNRRTLWTILHLKIFYTDQLQCVDFNSVDDHGHHWALAFVCFSFFFFHFFLATYA